MSQWRGPESLQTGEHRIILLWNRRCVYDHSRSNFTPGGRFSSAWACRQFCLTPYNLIWNESLVSRLNSAFFNVSWVSLIIFHNYLQSRTGSFRVAISCNSDWMSWVPTVGHRKHAVHHEKDVQISRAGGCQFQKITCQEYMFDRILIDTVSADPHNDCSTCHRIAHSGAYIFWPCLTMSHQHFALTLGAIRQPKCMMGRC